MTTINIYLNFNGNCEEAFTFYKSVFGGEFPYIGRYKDMPPQDGMPPLSADTGEKIMHISLPISTETVLLGCDMPGTELVKGNNFSISLNTDSKEEADRLFLGLSNGGKVTMPMNKTFWGSYFGMFIDKFGISWFISFEEGH